MPNDGHPSRPDGRADHARSGGSLILIALGVLSACFSGPPPSTAGSAGSYEGRWVHGHGASTSSGRSGWSASTTAREARLSGDDSQLLVEARLNGRVSGVFLLDTGASYCVITPEMASRLGVSGDPEKESIALETPAGRIKAPMTTLRSIEVAHASAGEVPTVIYPAVGEPLSGILGLSFLRQFEFSIDARRRVLRLRPF